MTGTVSALTLKRAAGRPIDRGYITGNVVMSSQGVPSGAAGASSWWKGLLKAALGGGALALGLGTACILTYLHAIGRVDLLQQVMGSKESLALVFSLTFAFAALYVLGIFFGSTLTHVALDQYPSVTAVPKRAAWVVLAVYGAWIVALCWLFAAINGGADPGEWVAFVFLGVMYVVSTGALLFLQHHHDQALGSRSRRIHAVLAGSLFVLAPAPIGPALLLVLKMNPALAHEASTFGIMALVLCVSVPGMVTSGVYAFSFVGTRSHRKAAVVAVAGTVALCALAILIVPRQTLFPVAVHGLRHAGVFTLAPATYAVDEKDLALAKAVGLRVIDADLHTVEGVERFRLGDTVVLCKTPLDLLDPGEGTAEALSHGCLDFKSDNLRRVTL